MFSLQLAYLLALLIINTVTAAPNLSIAAPTIRRQNTPNPVGWTPKPTARPLHRYPPNIFELVRRDLTQTCGYVDAISQYYVGCNSGYYCGYKTNGGPNSDERLFGCCSSILIEADTTQLSGCQHQTTCYSYGSGPNPLGTSAITW